MGRPKKMERDSINSRLWWGSRGMMFSCMYTLICQGKGVGFQAGEEFGESVYSKSIIRQ